MELLVGVAVDHGDGVVGPEVDLVLSVEPGHTVAEVVAALLGRMRPRPAARSSDPALTLARPSTAEVFDPGERVAGLGLVTGDALQLVPVDAGQVRVARRRRSTRTCPAGLVIEVCGGPDTGAVLDLDRPGRYLVGRDRASHLRLNDPGVDRTDLTLSWDGGSTVSLQPASGATMFIDGEPRTTRIDLEPTVFVRRSATVLVLRRRGHDPPPIGPTSPTVALHRTVDETPPPEPMVLGPPEAMVEEQEPTSFAYLAALMPLVMGVALALLFSPRFLFFAALSPLVAVAGYLDQRRRTRQRRRRSEARFTAALDRLVDQASSALLEERRRRRAVAPDLAELAQRVADRSPRLWGADERREEGLPVRLGIGTVTALVDVRSPTGGDEDQRTRADARLEPLRRLIDVPVTVDLARFVALGLVGPSSVTTPLAAALIIQIATRHRPDDVVVAAAVASGCPMSSWLHWLPHTRSPTSPLGGPHLITDEPGSSEAGTTQAGANQSGTGQSGAKQAGANRLVADLLDVADRREARSRGSGPALHNPRIVLLVDADLAIDPALVARLGALTPGSRVSVLWLTTDEDRVPANTGAVVNCPSLTARRPAQLRAPGAANEVVPVWPDGLTPAVARQVARGLAPLVDASSKDGGVGLPLSAGLADVFGIRRFDSSWVDERWRRSCNPGLAAPIGIGGGGPLVVDLFEDGPHCLIGGTSGSGKSELTISLVASLLASHPPERLNVLFVDYKGGATGEAFASAPHTVGCVTNLDASLAQRALTSLRAELHRRMDLLRGRAKDLPQLAAQDPDGAPPALLIVIDEFATLVAEVPEFMAGIVDLAQRGRSLGLHLLLATQRPAAAVSDNILANTNLRICLRTVDGIESSSVIGSPDAAAIAPGHKGRGLIRLGPGEPMPFQAAWATAPPPPPMGRAAVSVRPFHFALELSTAHRATGPPPGPASTGSAPAADGPPSAQAEPSTQLDELMTALREAAVRRGSSPARPPWLPELPASVPLSMVTPADSKGSEGSAADLAGGGKEAERAAEGLRLTVGLIDAPDQQAQFPAAVDLNRSGGILIFGAGGSGKTTALHTLAEAAAIDPAPITLFVLDFASRRLASLADRPCCAAVGTGDDLEAVTRIIAVLEEELAHRRSTQAGQAGPDQPAVDPLLLLIDDYGNLAQTFEGSGVPSGHHQWFERLNRLIIDGRQVGLASAITATRRAEIRAAVWGGIGERLVLRCVDEAAARDLGIDPSALGPEPPPGRGVLSSGRVVQWASASDPSLRPGAAGIGTTNPIRGADPETGTVHEAPAARQEAQAARRQVVAARRLRVPPLPDDLPPFPPPEGDGLRVRLGVIDLRPDPFEVDLGLDDLTIVGPPRSGRSTALAAVAAQAAGAGRSVVACGPSRSPLAYAGGVSRWFPVDARSPGALDGLAALIEEVRGEHRPVLLVDGIDQLDDPSLEPAMARVAAIGLPLVAAATSMRGYGLNPLWQQAKRARNLILLGPPDPLEAQELAGTPVAIRPGIERRPGRALAVVEGRPSVVQLANARPANARRSTAADRHRQSADPAPTGRQ